MAHTPLRRLSDIAPDAAYWAVLVILLVASAAFTLDVQRRRGAWSTDTDVPELQSGDTVKVVRAIDGDEVSVAHPGGTLVVRLLGIKAFDPGVQEPGISAIGQACAAALVRLEGQEVQVEFDERKLDKAGRLLAYLRAGERDLGRSLVEEGLALVYTRYPFSREEAYRSAEAVAKTRSEGLWGNPRASVRAEALKGTWEAQRQDG